MSDNIPSPEQLLKALNNSQAQTISDLSSELAAQSAPLSDGFGCSLPLVKDEDSSPRVGISIQQASISNNHVDSSALTQSDEINLPPNNTHKKKVIFTRPESDGDFDGVDIKDPVELLYLLDEELLSGQKRLHDWQIQFMLDFAHPGHAKEKPFQAVVQACNSSGKDKYIIAACAVWLCMRYREVECPITSSSGAQLDNQTCAHLDRLCHKANAVFGPLWKINYRYYECQHVGEIGEKMPSKLKLFATDEAGKAEGYHPVDMGKKMAIFTSETKSIPEAITEALERCHGFTHRVDCSSPGSAAGYFYNVCSSALPREQIQDITSVTSVQTILYKVTVYDCPHITQSEIDRMIIKTPGGEKSTVFRSSMLAEFGSTDEMVVIPSDFVWRAIYNLPSRKSAFTIEHIPEDYNEAGLDLSDGGAETVLVVRNGNKVIGLECFNFNDTEDTITYLQELFRKYNLLSKFALIRGDYCGMGGPMLRSLKRKGWSNVRFVDSRNKAAEPKTFSNRGTELFFNMRELLQNRDIILPYDKLLIEQLCTRYYKLRDGSIYQLLTKLEQRSKGFPSPDRADALNLCFWNYKTNRKFEDSETITTMEPEVQINPNTQIIPEYFDQRDWVMKTNSRFCPEHIQLQDMEDLQEDLSAWNNKQTK